MTKMSYKYKIYMVIAGTIVAALIFFYFISSAMSARNAGLAGVAATKNQEYAAAVAEQQSYELGKKDLTTLAAKPVQPGDLFSHDTSVVKEIKVLETLSGNLGITFVLTISGTVKTIPKLSKSSAQLYSVPYSVTLEGPFDKVVNFIETSEHLGFITQTKGLTLGGLKGDSVHATLNSEFYIQP